LILENWNEFSFGPSGIANIPRPGLFGIEMNIEQATIYLYFLMIHDPLHHFVVNRLQDSRIGRAWIALREDEVACQAMGIDKRKTKLMAFALGATWAGFAGVVFAAKTTFHQPGQLHHLGIHHHPVCGGAGGHGIDRGRYSGAFILILLPNTSGFFRIPHAGLRRRAGNDDGVPARRHRGNGGGLTNTKFRPIRAATDCYLDSMTMEPILDVKQLTMDFGGLRALDEVDLDVKGRNRRPDRPQWRRQDHFFQLHHRNLCPHQRRCPDGPERAGEADQWPQAQPGHGKGNGQDLSEYPPVSKHDRSGKCHDRLPLPHEEPAFWARCSEAPPPDSGRETRHQKSYSILEKIGLEKYVNDFAKNLPYGAQRRLEIARAMATEPFMLLLDEPAAGMNPQETKELDDLIINMRKTKGFRSCSSSTT
jgi:hypothetical protein